MKKTGTIIALVLTAIVSINAQSINTEKSVVNFTTKGMFGKEVTGTFTGMKGQVQFDESNLAGSGFDVTIDAGSIFTDNKKRDNHLKTEDFFEVETYLEIRFKSQSVEKTSDGYVTKGEITMHGVSHPASIAFTYANNTLKGTLEINRFDYKIGEDIKTKMVAELAQVEIICVLN